MRRLVATGLVSGLVTGLVLMLGLGGSALLATPAGAAGVSQAAPYEYLGWGNPPAPAAVMAVSGVHDLTLAFVLSKKACDPAWDGTRPLTGGADQAAINAVRAAGGDVVVSFGGWSGRKLGQKCKTVAALAAAYQKVISTYGLNAIDVDLERGEMGAAVVKRVVAALAAVRRANPSLEISITFGVTPTGPDKRGRKLIASAAAIGFLPTSWTVMPFDFGTPVANMGQVSINALVGTVQYVVSAYHLSAAVAYTHAGISSMNGRTDEADETVTLADFQSMLAFAQQFHLARFTFWSVNRDRPCGAVNRDADSCSGIAQQPYDFAKVVAEYQG